MKNGIYTNQEMIGTIINDLNDVLKLQNGGQYIQACAVVTGMAQKLVNLRQTIDDDLKNRDETIESLKHIMRQNGLEIVEVAPEALKEGEA